MSVGAATVRPSEDPATWRGWCLGGALVVLVVALVPPFSDAARRTEYAEALQFSLLALVVPALLVIGAPWRRLRLSGKDATEWPADQIADRRMRHRQLSRSLGFIACDLGFHALLMSMANNSRLQKIINDTRLLISIFAIHRGGHDRATLKSIHRYHQRILNAVAHQEPEAAMAAVVDGFDRVRLPEILSFTATVNERSWRVMERIGMRRVEGGDFEHPWVPHGHELRPHVLYRFPPPQMP